MKKIPTTNLPLATATINESLAKTASDLLSEHRARTAQMAGLVPTINQLRERVDQALGIANRPAPVFFPHPATERVSISITVVQSKTGGCEVTFGWSKECPQLTLALGKLLEQVIQIPEIAAISSTRITAASNGFLACESTDNFNFVRDALSRMLGGGQTLAMPPDSPVETVSVKIESNFILFSADVSGLKLDAVAGLLANYTPEIMSNLREASPALAAEYKAAVADLNPGTVDPGADLDTKTKNAICDLTDLANKGDSKDFRDGVRASVKLLYGRVGVKYYDFMRPIK